MSEVLAEVEKIQKQNIGNAGEYYVASILSAKNFTATITLGRAERYDILAVSPSGKTYKFSVKTRFKKETTSFTLSECDERGYADDLYYVFVRLHEFKSVPEVWVVPSKRVCEIIGNAHKKWLSAKNREGGQHNDTSMRKLVIEARGSDSNYYPVEWLEEIKKYHNNFDILS